MEVDPWLAFATRTQSSLSLLHGFCYHQSVGTHNSAITSTYRYGAEDKYYSMILSASYLQFNEVRTVSQYYSLTDQLNMGVRHIELDIHFFHDRLRVSHCGFTVGIVNYLFHYLEHLLRRFHFRYDTETIGCLPSFNGIPAGSSRLGESGIEDQLRIEIVLEELREWLAQTRNRDELIVVYLDVSDNLVRWKQEEALAKTLEEVLGEYLIRTNETASLHELVRRNKRVMLVSRRQLHNPFHTTFFTLTNSTCTYPSHGEAVS